MGEEDKKTAELSRLSRDIPNLIRGIEKIKSRREGIIDATKARFNVFTTLLQAHDEVRLHTRFITAMLDGSKNASHGCGTLFLRLFLETIDKIKVDGVNVGLTPQFTSLLENDKEFESIHKEYHTGDKGNIDILIKFNDAILAIENKINAGEQENQLLGYFEYLERSHKSEKYLFFLTLRGHKADSSKDKPYFKISYHEHIIPWLDLCLEKTYSYPNINSVIGQYKKVVQQLLSNNSFEEEDMKEIKELIEKNPAIVKYLSEISKCVEEVKRVYQKMIFDNLVNKLPAYKIHTPQYNEWQSTFKIILNNNFFAENDHLMPTVEIDNIFSPYCEIYLFLPNISNKSSSRQVNNILEKINNLFRTQEPGNYCDKISNNYSVCCYIVRDAKDVINEEWLYKALNEPIFIDDEATKYAKKINKYLKIIDSACTN